MKKLVLVGAAFLTSIALVACGSSNSTTSKSSQTSKTSTVKVSKPKSQEFRFSKNVAEIHDVKIEITSQKVIPAGEGINSGEKPLLAFWYKVTNKTNKEIDPTSAWLAVFEAYQDTSKSQENKLEVGSLPDEKYLKTQTENIKQNATAENAVSYELDDTTTPVILQAHQGIDGKKIGEQKYEIK
jgi:ABC-type phosphate transport system substrate-binding protein